MEQIIIEDYVCWICGQVFSSKITKTMHHTIPLTMKPYKNVIVPLCEDCHERINSENFQGLVSYACKINASVNSVVSETKKLNEFLENNSKLTIKDILKNKEK